MVARSITGDDATGGDYMAIHIVEDVPSGRLVWQRFVRVLSVVVGLVLIAAGLIAASLPILFVVAVVFVTAQGDIGDTDWTNDWQTLAVGTAIAVVGLWAGLRLVRGRRRLGLYLRKFGFTGTTHTVSRALRSAVGRSVRLVTLDDSATAPVGVGQGTRNVARLVFLVSLAGVGLLLWAFKAGAFDLNSKEFIDQAQEQAGDSTKDQIGAGFGGIFAYAAVQAFVYAAVLLMISTVAAIALFTWRAVRRATKAQQNATRALQHEGQIGATARQLADAAKYVFSPRLMVLTVPTGFWQKAISGLLDIVDVVIVDVSQPTDALLWEINSLKSRLNRRVILVGQLDLVAPLAVANAATQPTASGLLARMLDGETILAYRPTDTGRFIRALRARLANLPRR
jgi:hypothetical protein